MPIVCCTQASHSDVTEARIRTRTLYGWKGPSLLIVNTRGGHAVMHSLQPLHVSTSIVDHTMPDCAAVSS